MYLFRHMIDQTADNTTEIKHRINQTRKAINALNSIQWRDGGNTYNKSQFQEIQNSKKNN